MVNMNGALSEGTIYDLESAVYDVLREMHGMEAYRYTVPAGVVRIWVRRVCDAAGLNYEGIRSQVHDARRDELDLDSDDTVTSSGTETETETESDSY